MLGRVLREAVALPLRVGHALFAGPEIYPKKRRETGCCAVIGRLFADGAATFLSNITKASISAWGAVT
jgi:hypothetical protein